MSCGRGGEDGTLSVPGRTGLHEMKKLTETSRKTVRQKKEEAVREGGRGSES